MAYRTNTIGLLVKLSPEKAAKQITAAYAKADDGEPGRADAKAAALLGISKSTIKRIIKQLEDVGLQIERPSDSEAIRMAKAKRDVALQEQLAAQPKKRRKSA